VRQILILAKYTIIEALFTGFFMVLLAIVAVALGLVAFLEQIVLFEKIATQASLLAAFLRLSAIYLLALFVINSLNQEFNQQRIYFILALALSRRNYILGKSLGFAVIALLVCLVMGGLLLFYSQNLLIWLISLYLELLLIIAIAMLFSINFQHNLLAITAVISFYVLGRSINAIQLSAYSLQHSPFYSEQILYYTTQFVALILPDLSRFTRSEWLIYPVNPIGSLWELAIQSAIYLLLLFAMILFDFYRKNL
jgi:Cu-processing system permease protein